MGKRQKMRTRDPVWWGGTPMLAIVDEPPILRKTPPAAARDSEDRKEMRQTDGNKSIEI
jgi:hypothetical protein